MSSPTCGICREGPLSRSDFIKLYLDFDAPEMANKMALTEAEQANLLAAIQETRNLSSKSSPQDLESFENK